MSMGRLIQFEAAFSMPFTAKQHTERIYPPPTLPGIAEGDWVEIETDWTAALRQRMDARGFNNTWDPTVQRFSLRADPLARKLALLETIVVAWSDPAPVTPEALADLHPLVHDWICGEFDRLAAPRTEPEKNGSRPSSSAGPQAATASPVSSGT